MSAENRVDVAVIGAGIAGIATAYYLSTREKIASVLLIDSRQAMSFTSAQSGDNYRNWWPHPTMVDFTNDSIDLMEGLARESSNVFHMTRRGYAVATRRKTIDDLIAELYDGYATADDGRIRIRANGANDSYERPGSASWEGAPDGVDVLSNQALIRSVFPSFGTDIEHVIHIRRAGDINGHQLGQHMLERFRDAGGKKMNGELRGLERGSHYVLGIETGEGTQTVRADRIVNAAGPFAGKVAAMIDRPLPLKNTFQQKIAFEDTLASVPRNMPFAIDLDQKRLSWSEEERESLSEDPDLAWLTEVLPGGTHCRPDGGDDGKRVKLGWAYNSTISAPQDDLANEPKLDAQFPEIVIRGAMSLIPSLAAYVEEPPARFSHYGGYYTMTEENWPLIGPLDDDGAFVVGALSGFGSMAACAAGSLCASWACGGELPGYAMDLSLSRYDNPISIDELRASANKGLL